MRGHSKLKVVVAAIACAALTCGAAFAGPSVRIGKITSEKTCSYYENSAYSSSASASASDTKTATGSSSSATIRASESWRSWWVKDCTSNFASMRASLEAAIAASGKISVKDRSPGYTLTATVSTEGSSSASFGQHTSRGADFDLSADKMFATMDVALADASGKKVFGAMIRKEITLSSAATTDGIQANDSQDGQAIYNTLQQQLALAAARKIAFHLEPLVVTASDGGETIRLNYGAPYLTLGTPVQATSGDGLTVIRYNVVAADDNGATAEVDGDGKAERIVPGSTAVVIEQDDPAANGRRLKGRKLP